ncbi:MAG: lysylphosphatidylglycerol synthase transmembrane domain-containing protein [Microbacter sp.]
MKRHKSNWGRNLFFIIGVIALLLMAWGIGFDNIWIHIRKTGWWFFAIIGMWLPIYIINTTALTTIIRDNNPLNHKIPFLHILKITLSAFALKAATPLGFFGGDPYKIMEFKSLFGLEKATSSVVLYTMTHISAHIIFWVLSIVAAAIFLPIHFLDKIFLVAFFIIFSMLLFLLWRGYRKGMAFQFFHWASHIPLIKRWGAPFFSKNQTRLYQIDQQISLLYSTRPKAFARALSLELLARIGNAFEVFVILMPLNLHVTVIQSIIIYSFVSLFTNILFFSPMQIGTREGAFVLAFKAFALPAGLGVYVSLVMRVRELFWIVLGILLMKINFYRHLQPVGNVMTESSPHNEVPQQAQDE